jgi:hypothetical protein
LSPINSPCLAIPLFSFQRASLSLALLTVSHHLASHHLASDWKKKIASIATLHQDVAATGEATVDDT